MSSILVAVVNIQRSYQPNRIRSAPANGFLQLEKFKEYLEPHSYKHLELIPSQNAESSCRKPGSPLTSLGAMVGSFKLVAGRRGVSSRARTDREGYLDRKLHKCTKLMTDQQVTRNSISLAISVVIMIVL
jgi:hypothetical protein